MKTIFRVMDSIYGERKGSIRDSGTRIRCMDMVLWPGKIIRNMLVILKKARNMDKVYYNGLMVASMMENGFKENNRE